MSSPRVLGLDLGNSRLKALLLPEPSVESPPVSAFASAPRQDLDRAATVIDGADQVRAWMSELRRADLLPAADIHLIAVDPTLAAELHAALVATGCRVRRWQTADLGLRHPYADVAALGVDRALAAWTAARLDPGRRRLIVDAGSAVTLDLVDEDGAFLGGAIAPGLPLLARGIATGKQLGVVLDGAERAMPRYPAENTADALALGLDAAFAGAIEVIVRQALTQIDERPAPVTVTGGDGPRAALALERLGLPCRIDRAPHLLQQGLWLLARGDP